ncbi:hypothetical protein EI171_33665 [Bradyrhizobium sp. LCT2]|nr:hypothetical protein EI171_33665 [Bradyrhizobium sp. LCT2]
MSAPVKPACGSRGAGSARLQAETRQVAVVIRDLGAGHQEAVDRGHETREQGGGGGESDGSGLGHRNSFLETVSSAVSFRKGIYVYQMPMSMHAIA